MLLVKLLTISSNYILLMKMGFIKNNSLNRKILDTNKTKACLIDKNLVN